MTPAAPHRRRAVGALCLLFAVGCAGTALAQAQSDFARVFGDPLTRGIRSGDGDAVRRALIRGYNPSKRYTQDITPLMLAGIGGQPEIAAMLLDYGANIRTRDKLGNTALIYAAGTGHVEVLKVLLDHGAMIDVRNERGVSALIQAARNGHSAAVEELVRRGADVTLTDHTGRSALDWARENRHQAIVRLLQKERS
ncbi:MAG: ankyrin repeat domain-containing protein [Kiloniellales bacterium]